MNSAAYVDELISDQKAQGKPLQESAWDAAMACVGWAYVYGSHGEYCDPSNRRRWASDEHPKIKENCKNFSGRDDRPGGCVGCKWFLGSAESDQTKHEGRTRFFDCRGFVYWILHNTCGMWEKCPAGATTIWNTASNWKAKGTVKGGVPEDTLVCLFVQSEEDPRKMAHVGFGFHGETCECSSGVQHFKTRKPKWTHWAVPVCIDGEIPTPTPEPTPGTDKPTLRKGDRGSYVTLAQTELIQHGYSVGDTGADGVFGNNTEKAVKRFQQDNVGEDGTALKVDGVIGKQTWWALDQTDIPLYTVIIPHLSKHHAEALVTNYSGATMTEERG